MPKIVCEKGYSYGFDPSACETCKGRCCVGESGYIWISKDEISKLAKSLNISIDEFVNEYLLKIGYRYSIKELEYEDGYRCAFFDTSTLSCSVYEYRPNQCRTFPFWEHFKKNQSEVKEECPGIITL